MARELNVEESTFVEESFTLDGVPMKRITFSNAYGLPPHERAAKLAAEGKTAAVVTERITWRGKNGKRTREEVSRVEYPAVVAG